MSTLQLAAASGGVRMNEGAAIRSGLNYGVSLQQAIRLRNGFQIEGQIVRELANGRKRIPRLDTAFLDGGLHLRNQLGERRNRCVDVDRDSHRDCASVPVDQMVHLTCATDKRKWAERGLGTLRGRF
jgi:hypothetical protein